MATSESVRDGNNSTGQGSEPIGKVQTNTPRSREPQFYHGKSRLPQDAINSTPDGRVGYTESVNGREDAFSGGEWLESVAERAKANSGKAQPSSNVGSLEAGYGGSN